MNEVIVSVECQVQILILVFFQFLFILKQTRVAKKLHNEEMVRFIKRKKQQNKRRQRFRQYMLRRRKLFSVSLQLSVPKGLSTEEYG